MKSITIAGNVGKDAEMRTTQNGTQLASFSVAVNHFDGREKSTMWFDVTMFGKRAQSVLQFATKGSKICVTGELGMRENNGKTYLSVTASDFTPMGGQPNQGGYDQPPSGYGAGGRPGGDVDSDEIPFECEWRV